MDGLLIQLPKTSAWSERRTRGFTLIELMIVVAVVAILAALAYPSYTRYIVRSKRAAAQGYMLEVTNLQQRYLLDARSYAPDTTTLNALPPPSVGDNYAVKIDVGATPPTFTLTLTAKGGQAAHDAACSPLKITQTGEKTPQPTGGGDSCW